MSTLQQIRAELLTRINSLQTRLISMTPNDIVFSAIGEAIVNGCKVVQGESTNDYDVLLTGKDSADSVHRNPFGSDTPTRGYEYWNIASGKDGAFRAGEIEATVDDPPATGLARYDIAYVYVGPSGSGFAIAAGTPSTGVKDDFDTYGLDDSPYGEARTTDVTLPMGALPVARIYVEDVYTGIQNARIADIRQFYPLAGFQSVNANAVVHLNADGQLTSTAGFEFSGGTLTVQKIDGAIIGSATPAAGTFTTLSATGTTTFTGNVGFGVSPSDRVSIVGGGSTTSTVNITGGSGNDNATLASDYSLIFQVDANNSVGGRGYTWRYGGKGYSDGTELMSLDASGNLTISGNTTLSGGTANGVVYLNGSKVATSGTSFIFDGTNAGIGVTPPAGFRLTLKSVDGTTAAGMNLLGPTASTGLSINAVTSATDTDFEIWNAQNGYLRFGLNNAEQMRLTTTGLGIGTTPTLPFDLTVASAQAQVKSSTGTNSAWLRFNNTGGNFYIGRESSAGSDLCVGASAYAGVISVATAYSLHLGTNNLVRTTIDESGNWIQKLNSSAPTLSSNSTMTFELTSDTTLTIVVRGSDGTTRSGTISLT